MFLALRWSQQKVWLLLRRPTASTAHHAGARDGAPGAMGHHPCPRPFVVLQWLLLATCGIIPHHQTHTFTGCGLGSPFFDPCAPWFRPPCPARCSLAPAGFGWGGRMKFAVIHGCIPIIVQVRSTAISRRSSTLGAAKIYAMVTSCCCSHVIVGLPCRDCGSQGAWCTMLRVRNALLSKHDCTRHSKNAWPCQASSMSHPDAPVGLACPVHCLRCLLQDGVLVEWEEQLPLHRYALRFPM